MITTNLTATDLLTSLQLHGVLSVCAVEQLPDASGELCVPPPPNSSLWTDGLPDPIKIKNKMDVTVDRFINHVYPPLEDGPFYYLRLIRQRKAVQAEFYATMSYYESLLASSAAPAPPQSTITVVPYEPAAKRRRGRPRTGIKPRDRRVKKDDDSY